MSILLLVSFGLNVALVYATFNLLRKLELYEQTIEQFYSRLSIALHNMRLLDQKQMFESDDEVGSVFSQLVDIINNLRPILYGNTDEESEPTQ